MMTACRSAERLTAYAPLSLRRLTLGACRSPVVYRFAACFPWFVSDAHRYLSRRFFQRVKSADSVHDPTGPLFTLVDLKIV
jgi:hypothetical protein